MSPSHPKITISPLYGLEDLSVDAFDRKLLPFEITGGVYLDDVAQDLQALDYRLWVPRYLSERQVSEITGWTHGIVNRYEGEPYSRESEDTASEELVRKIVLALRIVRPTRKPYNYLQARRGGDGQWELFGFQEVGHLLMMPEAEVLNRVRTRDALELRAIGPRFLKALDQRYQPILRAVQLLDFGYSSQWRDVQFLLWATALDGLFTSSERKNRGASLASKRIKYFLGPDFPIYPPGELNEFEEYPPLVLADVIGDIYRMRNRLAHGEFIPKEYLNRSGRRHLGGNISYAAVLLEAVSAILRGALIKIFKEDMLDTMGDKSIMNAHFAKAGLVG